VALAFAIYAALTVIGAPIWLLVRPAPLPVSDAFACPVVGLAVLQVFSWYWLRYADGGMSRGLPILAAAVFVSLFVVWWLRGKAFRRPSLTGCASTFATFAAVGAVFMIEFRVPFRIGHLTAGSIWNADIALYANVSSALVAHGFSWAGNIAGINLGVTAMNAQGIGPGVYSTLAAVAAGTGLGTWQVALSLLLVGVALGAVAIRDTARLLLPRSDVAASLIAVLATMASLFAYVTTNYFLAQVLVVPLALGEVLVLHWIARQSRPREWARGLVLLAAMVLIAVLSYSPMAFVMQPVLVAVVCLGEIGRGWWRRSVTVVAAVLGAFVAAYAFVPAPFTRSFEFIRVSLLEERGWPLGLMTPLDLLGFRQAVRGPRPNGWAFLLEALMVGVIVIAAVWALWSEQCRAALVLAAAVAVILASYAVVYYARGVSYEQWKWISFFQPMLFVAVFALVVAAAGVLMRRWFHPPRLAIVAVASVLAFVLMAASARILVTGTAKTRAVWVKGQPTIEWSVVRTPLSDLADRPALTRLKAVNVGRGAWDEMWAAYFLQPTTRVYLLGPSYLPISPPGAPWTIVSELDPAARPRQLPALRYVVVSKPPGSASGPG